MTEKISTMKKTIKTILCLTILLIYASVIAFAGNVEFKDVKAGDWYAGQVTELTNRGFINGYPDGTFRPQGQITRAEFSKVLIVATGEKATISKSGHWATGYITACTKKGLIKEKEFDDIDKAITRGEIAMMISRAIGNTTYDEKLKDFILDLNKTTDKDKVFIMQAYASGIMGGYPDNTFKAGNTATRAEAVAMIMRFLEPKQRRVPLLKQDAGTWTLSKINSFSEEIKINVKSKTITHYTVTVAGELLSTQKALNTGIRSIPLVWSDTKTINMLLFESGKLTGIGKLEAGGKLNITYKE